MQYQTQSRPASAGRTFDNIAAPTLVGAGRGLFTGALQSNPLVALGALLISPILGLFRKRPVAPNHINQLKLETYSSRPARATVSPAFGLTRRIVGQPMDNRWKTDGKRCRKTPAQKGGSRHG